MKKITVLVSSFDGFADCWDPFYHGLRKYWPDCPYEVAFITNFKEINLGSAQAIKVGTDRGWSDNMLTALEQIESSFILYAQEDYWINQRVDTKTISDYVELLIKDKADYIRLYPAPPPDLDYLEDERLGILADDAPYRTSLQMALWRKSVLKNLIKSGENPWQFEVDGTLRSRSCSSRFMCVKTIDNQRHHGINYVCTAINKGKWSRAAKRYAQAEGLDIDFSNRPNETWWDDFGRDTLFGARVVTAITKPDYAVKRVISEFFVKQK